MLTIEEFVNKLNEVIEENNLDYDDLESYNIYINLKLDSGYVVDINHMDVDNDMKELIIEASVVE